MICMTNTKQIDLNKELNTVMSIFMLRDISDKIIQGDISLVAGRRRPPFSLCNACSTFSVVYLATVSIGSDFLFLFLGSF